MFEFGPIFDLSDNKEQRDETSSDNHEDMNGHKDRIDYNFSPHDISWKDSMISLPINSMSEARRLVLEIS